MKNNSIFFTTGEFSKIHNVNKRTLHYYDEIGVFSPKYKGENGYRYYTYEQSMEFENILALRELNMSIEEIREYLKNPNSGDFIKIADVKIEEINNTINRLKNLKGILNKRKEMLKLSDNIYDGKIEIVELKEEYLLITKLNIVFEDNKSLINNAEAIINHLRTTDKITLFKESCGSIISIDKILNNEFDEYDGIFSVISSKSKNLYKKEKGTYIRGFLIGDWDRTPELYKKIIEFAKNNKLNLKGYAYERGLNEFAIKGEEEYVTQIEIKCERK